MEIIIGLIIGLLAETGFTYFLMKLKIESSKEKVENEMRTQMAVMTEKGQLNSN